MGVPGSPFLNIHLQFVERIEASAFHEITSLDTAELITSTTGACLLKYTSKAYVLPWECTRFLIKFLAFTISPHPPSSNLGPLREHHNLREFTFPVYIFCWCSQRYKWNSRQHFFVEQMCVLSIVWQSDTPTIWDRIFFTPPSPSPYSNWLQGTSGQTSENHQKRWYNSLKVSFTANRNLLGLRKYFLSIFQLSSHSFHSS